MSNNLLFILADPNEPQFPRLRRELADVSLVIGKSADVFANRAEEATVLFNWSGSLGLFKQVFAMCRNLRWVHSRSVGLERTLFPELVQSAVPLTNGVGVFSAALGEFALGAMLYFAKDFRRLIRNQQTELWEEFDVVRLAGQTVGIVGYGDIGNAVASRARAMGMRVLGLKRHASPDGGGDSLVERVYSPDQRREMIAQCDYVVVATPLTRETRGMMGEEEFAAMKRTAVVINIGRGPIIDETALIRALTGGRIKGAALDVFDTEPLPPGHSFYKMENVLLSPHCADHTADWLDNAMQFFIEQCRRFQKGEPLLHVVDKRLGY